MFTGLIEEIGIIQSVTRSEKAELLSIRASVVLKGAKVGDSICTNGVCLTITELNANSFTAFVMPETMRRSNLKKLTSGSEVNLERALSLQDRLGGHILSGHIDGTGNITKLQSEGDALWITISTQKKLLRYIIQKGSIAIDGVSLTVANINSETFQVSIIPHTKAATTLLSKKEGDEVNLECDILGKYIEKLMLKIEPEPKKKDIDLNLLIENGFF
jgi:riboflavin synthase